MKFCGYGGKINLYDYNFSTYTILLIRISNSFYHYFTLLNTIIFVACWQIFESVIIIINKERGGRQDKYN